MAVVAVLLLLLMTMNVTITMLMVRVPWALPRCRRRVRRSTVCSSGSSNRVALVSKSSCFLTHNHDDRTEN